jgi:hypothetical protein
LFLILPRTGGLPLSLRFLERQGGDLFSDGGNAAAFAKNAKGCATLHCCPRAKKGTAAGRALSISSLREIRLATA